MVNTVAKIKKMILNNSNRKIDRRLMPLSFLRPGATAPLAPPQLRHCIKLIINLENRSRMNTRADRRTARTFRLRSSGSA